MGTSPKTKDDCVSMTKEKKKGKWQKKVDTLVFHLYYNIFIIIEVAWIWRIVALFNQNLFLFVVLLQHFCYYLIEITEENQ